MKDQITLKTNLTVNAISNNIVFGSPGCGKTSLILAEAIKQYTEKNFSIVLYDYNFGALTKFAYNCQQNYAENSQFNILNFENVAYSNRCNPLHPDLIPDFAEAKNIAEGIISSIDSFKNPTDFDLEFLNALNIEEEQIDFLSICIWLLKLKSDLSNKTYCSYPHLIELVTSNVENIFNLLTNKMFLSDINIKNYIISLFPLESKLNLNLDNSNFTIDYSIIETIIETLEIKLASLRLFLPRATSENLYYVMTESNDASSAFVNTSLSFNEDKPKILSIGNNPAYESIYSVPLSLYYKKLFSLNTQKHLKTAFILDEFTTLPFSYTDLLNLIKNDNQIATWFSLQDLILLKNSLNFDELKIDTFLNSFQNIFTGAVFYDTAAKLSEQFGYKIPFLKAFKNISLTNIAELNLGEFAGIIDSNHKKKYFKEMLSLNQNERTTLNQMEVPKIFDFEKAGLNQKEVLKNNFLSIKKDIKDLLNN